MRNIRKKTVFAGVGTIIILCVFVYAFFHRNPVVSKSSVSANDPVRSVNADAVLVETRVSRQALKRLSEVELARQELQKSADFEMFDADEKKYEPEVIKGVNTTTVLFVQKIANAPVEPFGIFRVLIRNQSIESTESSVITDFRVVNTRKEFNPQWVQTALTAQPPRAISLVQKRGADGKVQILQTWRVETQDGRWLWIDAETGKSALTRSRSFQH